MYVRFVYLDIVTKLHKAEFNKMQIISEVLWAVDGAWKLITLMQTPLVAQIVS